MLCEFGKPYVYQRLMATLDFGSIGSPVSARLAITCSYCTATGYRGALEIACFFSAAKATQQARDKKRCNADEGSRIMNSLEMRL